MKVIIFTYIKNMILKLTYEAININEALKEFNEWDKPRLEFNLRNLKQ